MSLISEALKRQQLERDGKAPPVEAEVPADTDSADQLTENSDDVGARSTLSLAAAAAAAAAAGPVGQAPPPPPPPPPPMQPTVDTAEEPAIAETVVQEGKAENTGAPGWVVLTSAIVVIVLLVGVAVWAGMFFFERISSKSQGVSIASPAAEAPAVEQRSETVSPQELDPAPGMAVVSTPNQPVVELRDTARPDPPDAEPGVAAETPRQPAQSIARKADIIWPRLSLSGLVGGKRGGAAIINNQVIGIGEAIEGVVVTDLTKKGATLEYQGERLFLHVGGAIE
jgi:hypothetical protein